ncbi:MAG: hypothetical protein OXG33_11655 [Chloroflexi bacterium]|nr:hypothetical protein [Chloroflexota bacterium]
MTGRFDHAFQAPVAHPNGLQATDEGLWIADQDEGRAFLVAPDDGAVIRSFATGAGKSSGVTFGHGALWMCSNGLPTTRPPTATDTVRTRIVKTDPHTGAILAQFRAPGDSDVHGLEWTSEGLWLTTLDQRALTLVDAESLAPRRTIPVPMDRAHGLGWDGHALWCAFTSDRMVLGLSEQDGAVLERLDLDGESFEPHGLTMRHGRLWICDAVTGAVWRQRGPDADSPAAVGAPGR